MKIGTVRISTASQITYHKLLNAIKIVKLPIQYLLPVHRNQGAG